MNIVGHAQVRPRESRNSHFPGHRGLRGCPRAQGRILRIPATTRKEARSHLDLGQIGHHDVGAGLAQRRRLPAVVDADDTAESAGMARFDAGDRVLYDDGAGRFHLEASRRVQECVGRRLAAEIQARDILPSTRVSNSYDIPAHPTPPRSCCWRTRPRS